MKPLGFQQEEEQNQNLSKNKEQKPPNTVKYHAAVHVWHHLAREENRMDQHPEQDLGALALLCPLARVSFYTIGSWHSTVPAP